MTHASAIDDTPISVNGLYWSSAPTVSDDWRIKGLVTAVLQNLRTGIDSRQCTWMLMNIISLLSAAAQGVGQSLITFVHNLVRSSYLVDGWVGGWLVT